MKQKYENNNSVLGNIIKQVRKDKGFTQEALGRLVGLGKASVSKIEKGTTHISVEDASILLEAMGEKLNVYVPGLYPSVEKKLMQIQFVMIAICWFADAKNMSRKMAYNYLLKHLGIKFLEENFEYEQTLPKKVIIDDLTLVCKEHAKSISKRITERSIVAV